MKKLAGLLLFIALIPVAGKSQTITTIAGNGVAGYSGDGFPAINALLSHPNQLAFDGAGNLFIAEDYNHVIRKIDASGTISTVAGNGTMGFSGDGFAAVNAQLNRPCGVAVDGAGNLYICDGDNNRIRKVDTGGNITTIAGTGTSGYSGDGFAALNAEIGFSTGICVDTAGNIYFATQSPGYCVRKINTSGIISTYAGNGTSGFSGDGFAANAAQLDGPASVCLDGAGNLYIGDLGGMRIRKVNTSGIISTVAGNGNAASGGDGMAATSAQLFYPYGVAVDPAGNIYICESGNNKIRKVNTLGIMSSFAGVGGIIGGYGGDNGPLLSAQFYHPSAITLDASGNIFIGDYENSAIRKITPASTVGVDEEKMNEHFMSVYPNPGNDLVTIHVNSKSEYSLKVFNLTNQLMYEKKNLSGNNYSMDISKFSEGVYFLEINSGENQSRIKLVKY